MTTCPHCGWKPPYNKDSSAEDQLVAHMMNVGHPK